MLNIKRKIQITLFVLVLISSTLLGLSMESMRLILIGIIGAALGFLITDWLKLFKIDGILANIASILILILAMKDFFGVDNIGKLVAVSNLLVYLQTVLLFQEKTPRLIWQVLVLSLLQVVVGAIFSLDLEAGILFVFYFGVAGFAMLLQSIYTDAFDIQRRNKRSAKALARLNLVGGPGLVIQTEPEPQETGQPTDGADSTTEDQQGSSRPLAFFDPAGKEETGSRSMYTHLGLWIAVSAIFTGILFYMVPRHSKPWFGPSNSAVSASWAGQSVNLDEKGLITQSGRIIFRVNMDKMDSEIEIGFDNNTPYFRGIALSSLVIEDGKTNWRAPYDRIFKELYQDLPDSPSNGGIPVSQSITMEETGDPLLYGLMPFYRAPDTPREISFCHEISAITRSKIGEVAGVAPYKYTSQTLVDENGKFCKAWPYFSNTANYRESPMSDDPPQWKWLTELDPKRYPGLVDQATRIASEVANKSGTKLDLFKALEGYFLDSPEFKYTLNFREVERKEGVDPIEDFCCNHKSGHCELYASALTIMLRQQNIPARLVLGFYGASRSDITGSYLVREKNAHAWVEAYLAPEDCTPKMFETGQAGKGGAWVILDPTPYTFIGEEAGVGEEAIDLARTVWDDYILGVESESTDELNDFSSPLFGLLQSLDVQQVDRAFRDVTRFFQGPLLKYAIGGGILFLFFLGWLRSRLFSVANVSAPRKVGRIRRFVAGAISLIAPGLGNWVMKGSADSSPTKFYSRLTDILSKRDLKREPSQTHREFAKEVSSRFEDHPSAGLIQSTVFEVTELFNEVRFGRVELEDGLHEQIDLSLNELESALVQPAS